VRFWLVRGYVSEGQERLTRLLAWDSDGQPTAVRAKACHGAGTLAHDQGEYEAACAFHQESLAIRREIGNRQGIAASLDNLGNVARVQGEYEAAWALYEECLAIFRELGDRRSIAGSLESLAHLATEQAQPRRAATLIGAAEALREVLGAPLPPNYQEEYDRSVAATRQALDEEAFAAAWEQGRALTWEEAIDFALNGGDTSSSDTRQPLSASHAALTS
jgi:tetratricopeptide (TPR) repeat protein